MSKRCDAKIGLEFLDEKKYKELEKHLIYTEDLYKVRLLRQYKYIELYNALRKDLKKKTSLTKNIFIALSIFSLIIFSFLFYDMFTVIKDTPDCDPLLKFCFFERLSFGIHIAALYFLIIIGIGLLLIFLILRFFIFYDKPNKPIWFYIIFGILFNIFIIFLYPFIN